MLHETLDDCDIDYDRINRGIVFFYRSAESLERGVGHMQILAEDGQAIEILDRDALVELEPALAAAKDRIAGGIYCPSDETGDCCKFTQGLASFSAQKGATFHYGTEILGIEVEADRVARILTSKGEFSADAYVLALGNHSPILARRVGISLRLTDVARKIEAEVGKPVTSSDHALAWHCLRLAGVDEAMPQFGRLYELPLPA